MNRFLLIRHGDCLSNGIVPGRMPGIHLSENGRLQIKLIAKILGGKSVDLIYSSPLERALETAQIMSEEMNIPIITEHKYSEIDFGCWTGKSFKELENDFKWKQFHFFRNGCRIPDGEIMIEVQSRMVAGIESAMKLYDRKIIAVISHNDPIKSLIAFYLGISLDLFQRIDIDTGSVSILELGECYVKVKGINMRNIMSFQENS